VKKKIILSIILFTVIISIAVSVIFYRDKKGYVALCFLNTSVKLTDRFYDITKRIGYKKVPSSFALNSDSVALNISKNDKLVIHTNSESNDAIQEVLFNYEYLKDFYKILKVLKAGSEIITLNGHDVKCKVYHVIISRNDFKKFCNEIKTDKTYDYVHYKVKKFANELSDKLGIEISESGISNILNSIMPETSGLYEKLKNDILVKLYIYNNCVCALNTSIDFENIDMTNIIVDIKLGDGKKLINYADIHFSCIINGKKFFLNATGHGDFDNADHMNLALKGSITYNHINFFDSDLSIVTDKNEYQAKGSYTTSGKSLNIRGSGNFTANNDGIWLDYKNFNGESIFRATIK